MIFQPWMDDARCAEVDPDLFFPEKGGSTKLAKQLCSSCPVLETCLDYANTNRINEGIWGGKSSKERSTARRSDY